MLIEERNYMFAGGQIKPFLEFYEREGLRIHVRNLGNLIGYFIVDIGNLNEIVHLWSFDDYKDRESRRAALYRDPEWLAFASRSLAPIRMRNRLLRPTRFSPIGGTANLVQDVREEVAFSVTHTL